MGNNFSNLFEVLPNINPTMHVLSPDNIMQKGLLSVFPNFEALLNNKFWSKFIEKNLMTSQFTYLFKHLKLPQIPKLNKVFPAIIPLGKSGSNRSK